MAQRPAVIAADLDHFKKLNDVYGHAAGDQALVNVADGVRSAVRISDIVCRYDGEGPAAAAGSASFL
jgi:diguanylate cyclase (GGDEF)-like protein